MNHTKSNKPDASVSTISLFICCFILAILFNILLYPSVFEYKPFGINAPIYLLCFYIVMSVALRPNFRLFSHPFHLIFALLLSICYVFITNGFLLFFCAIGIVFLVGEQMMLSLHQARYPMDSICFIGDSMIFWFGYPFMGMGKAIQAYFTSGNAKKTKGALIGMVIALPIALIILLLLSSADAVYQNFLQNIFGKVDAVSILSHLFVFLIAFCLVSGLVWSCLKKTQRTSATRNAHRAIAFQWTAQAVLLVIINLVLLSFSLIQFLYLFSGQVPQGMTYSQYARSGFWQLIIVSILVAAILIFSWKCENPASKKALPAKKALLTLLCLGVLVLLVSAFWRMFLYEKAYGLTRLRVYTQAFMIVFALTLIMIIAKLWVSRFALRKVVAILSLVCFSCLCLFASDGFIARQNVALQGEKTDYVYLSSLSCDALPYYIDELNEEDFAYAAEVVQRGGYDVLIPNVLEHLTRDEYYAILEISDNIYGQHYQLLKRTIPWQYYNYNRDLARQSMVEHKELISDMIYIAKNAHRVQYAY